MPAASRRTGATYIFWDKQRRAWYLRFRYRDTLGNIHWPRKRSPWLGAYRKSLVWAASRRLAIIQKIEDELRDAT